MKPNYRQMGVAFGIVLMSALECIDVYPRLPDPMATNFGGDGAAGGWSSKAMFMAIAAVSMAFWFGMFLAMPRLAARSVRAVDLATGLCPRSAEPTLRRAHPERSGASRSNRGSARERGRVGRL